LADEEERTKREKVEQEKAQARAKEEEEMRKQEEEQARAMEEDAMRAAEELRMEMEEHKVVEEEIRLSKEKEDKKEERRLQKEKVKARSGLFTATTRNESGRRSILKIIHLTLILNPSSAGRSDLKGVFIKKKKVTIEEPEQGLDEAEKGGVQSDKETEIEIEARISKLSYMKLKKACMEVGAPRDEVDHCLGKHKLQELYLEYYRKQA